MNRSVFCRYCRLAQQMNQFEKLRDLFSKPLPDKLAGGQCRVKQSD